MQPLHNGTRLLWRLLKYVSCYTLRRETGPLCHEPKDQCTGYVEASCQYSLQRRKKLAFRKSGSLFVVVSQQEFLTQLWHILRQDMVRSRAASLYVDRVLDVSALTFLQ